MVIYAAHWIASLLFLVAVGAVVAVLLWRFRVAVAYVLVTLVTLAVFIGGGLYWWNERAAQAAREEARVAAQKKRDAELEQYKRDMQTLRDSVVTALSAAKLDIGPPVPQFQTMEERLAYLRWLGTMSERLQPKLADWPTRKDFLQAAWYESKRAGVDVSLILGLIEASSNFRKFYASDRGSRGYLAISPHWVTVIGDGDTSKLFHMQTNLRFGCVILRHYVDQNNGDVYLSLQQYLADSRGLTFNSPEMISAIKGVFAAQSRWVYVDTPPAEATR